MLDVCWCNSGLEWLLSYLCAFVRRWKTWLQGEERLDWWKPGRSQWDERVLQQRHFACSLLSFSHKDLTPSHSSPVTPLRPHLRLLTQQETLKRIPLRPVHLSTAAGDTEAARGSYVEPDGLCRTLQHLFKVKPSQEKVPSVSYYLSPSEPANVPTKRENTVQPGVGLLKWSWIENAAIKVFLEKNTLIWTNQNTV